MQTSRHTNRQNYQFQFHLTFAYISVTNVQPYLTAMASIVSIIAGCFAINYYVKKIKVI